MAFTKSTKIMLGATALVVIVVATIFFIKNSTNKEPVPISPVENDEKPLATQDLRETQPAEAFTRSFEQIEGIPIRTSAAKTPVPNSTISDYVPDLVEGSATATAEATPGITETPTPISVAAEANPWVEMNETEVESVQNDLDRIQLFDASGDMLGDDFVDGLSFERNGRFVRGFEEDGDEVLRGEGFSNIDGADHEGMNWYLKGDEMVTSQGISVTIWNEMWQIWDEDGSDVDEHVNPGSNGPIGNPRITVSINPDVSTQTSEFTSSTDDADMEKVNRFLFIQSELDKMVPGWRDVTSGEAVLENVVTFYARAMHALASRDDIKTLNDLTATMMTKEQFSENIERGGFAVPIEVNGETQMWDPSDGVDFVMAAMPGTSTSGFNGSTGVNDSGKLEVRGSVRTFDFNVDQDLDAAVAALLKNTLASSLSGSVNTSAPLAVDAWGAIYCLSTQYVVEINGKQINDTQTDPFIETPRLRN